jgi:CubicO group peptidase (beta-lactamase class C family)
LRGVLALVLAGLAAPAAAQAPANPLDVKAARATDPVTMGWMQGTPPPPDKRIMVANGSVMAFPQLRWSFSHWPNLYPTARIEAPARKTELEAALRTDLDGLQFRADMKGRPILVIEDALDLIYSDGILVLHKGKVAYARLGGGLSADGRHIAWSVTKSVVGLLAEALVAEGKLDPERDVASYVPELQKSGFGNATVRQVMDMTTAIDWDEAYTSDSSTIARFMAAGGAQGTGKLPDGKPPMGFLAFLETVPANGTHGAATTYRTGNTDVLAWVIARATGQSLVQLLQDRFWQPMGMAHDAAIMVDPVGTPFAGGGLILALGDLARFGEMVRLNGLYNGRQIVPEAAITSIREGGDPMKFPSSSYPTLPGWSYRSQWWVAPDGVIMARGVHGQAIWIDQTREVVIARFGSHPKAGNVNIDPIALPLYRAIAERLAGR